MGKQLRSIPGLRSALCSRTNGHRLRAPGLGKGPQQVPVLSEGTRRAAHGAAPWSSPLPRLPQAAPGRALSARRTVWAPSSCSQPPFPLRGQGSGRPSATLPGRPRGGVTHCPGRAWWAVLREGGVLAGGQCPCSVGSCRMNPVAMWRDLGPCSGSIGLPPACRGISRRGRRAGPREHPHPLQRPECTGEEQGMCSTCTRTSSLPAGLPPSHVLRVLPGPVPGSHLWNRRAELPGHGESTQRAQQRQPPAPRCLCGLESARPSRPPSSHSLRGAVLGTPSC